MSVLKKIKHVVVLMMENRSFDHVFGGMRAEGRKIDVDLEFTNSDHAGKMHGMHALDDDLASVFLPGPEHGSLHVAKQIAAGSMSGFITDFQDVYGAKARHPETVMHYLQRAHQPVSYFLAEEYMVLERYFASIATGTLPNRFYSLCGTSNGARDNNVPRQVFKDLHHVFDDLADGDWAVYAGALPTVMMIGGLIEKKQNLRHLKRISTFLTEATAGELPPLSWIEPVYSWSSAWISRFLGVPEGPPNDDHVPSDTARGQKLLFDVYNALTARPDKWAETLLIVNYDEHGGFADHVPPPRIPKADQRSDKFEWMGPRVPAWLISPYAPRGGRNRTQLDHCSVLKFIADWFGKKPVGRAASANTASIADALVDIARTDIPRAPKPPAIAPRGAMDAPEQQQPAEGFESAVVAYFDELEREQPDQHDRILETLRAPDRSLRAVGPGPCGCNDAEFDARAAIAALSRKVEELARLLPSGGGAGAGDRAILQGGARVAVMPKPVGVSEVGWAKVIGAFASTNALPIGGDRIVGGQDAATGDFPSCVCLGNATQYFCTGALIHPRVVLTAAHCGVEIKRVMVGGTVIGPPTDGTVLGVRAVFRHPAYDRHAKRRNDLTVVILSESAVEQQPIAIATADELAAAGSVTLAGFGYNDPMAPIGFGTLRTVDVNLGPITVGAATAEDAALGEALGYDPSTEFVAGRKNLGKDSCNGDSGGPAYLQLDDGTTRLGGLTSRATLAAVANCGDGGIYVRPREYFAWIAECAAFEGITL